MQAKQKTVHHEWSTAISDRYTGQIRLLKDKQGRLEALQTTFIELTQKGLWKNQENEHRLVFDMRPLARDLEIDIDAWLKQYNYEPAPVLEPEYSR